MIFLIIKRYSDRNRSCITAKDQNIRVDEVEQRHASKSKKTKVKVIFEFISKVISMLSNGF